MWGKASGGVEQSEQKHNEVFILEITRRGIYRYEDVDMKMTDRTVDPQNRKERRLRRDSAGEW